MKTLVLLLTVIAALVLATAALSQPAAVATQKDVIRFSTPVILQGVTLQGEYLFVHDDTAMARGEACTYVYRGTEAIESKLVVSFHCDPIPRPKATHFTVTSRELSPGVVEVREYQYKGDTEAHGVPGLK
jgi:hypothetical protein